MKKALQKRRTYNVYKIYIIMFKEYFLIFYSY